MTHAQFEQSLSHRVLSGETGGWAAPIRGALAIGEAAYSTLIGLRNRLYDAPHRVRSVPVAVISVGNITVGGTGKTPLVMELVERLERLGRSPAVVARGYGAGLDEPGDEELLIRRRCPGAAYVANADRHRGAELAVESFGADVLVLDDAFQHRRLKRDLDIVLVDALCPFGYGHVLPRGLLREPLKGLSRAHLLVITRCDQVSRIELQRIESEIRKYNQSAPMIHVCTKMLAIEYLEGTPVKIEETGKRVLAFAAIGRPEAFASTLYSHGFFVVETRWLPDHHRYRLREIERLLDDRRGPAHDLVLTTEKDAVKLTRFAELDPHSIGVVRIGLEFWRDGSEILDRALAGALQVRRDATP